MRHTEREREKEREWERQKHRQREKLAPCREPDVGFDPRTPGSRPEPKADAQPLSHPGAPNHCLLFPGTLWGNMWWLRLCPYAILTFLAMPCSSQGPGGFCMQSNNWSESLMSLSHLFRLFSLRVKAPKSWLISHSVLPIWIPFQT